MHTLSHVYLFVYTRMQSVVEEANPLVRICSFLTTHYSDVKMCFI